MGCDIHCYVEKKAADGTWEKIGGFVSDYFKEGHEYFGKDEYKNADSPIDQRNYWLFARLAGVRADGNIPAISEPRGLPDDVSPEVKAKSDEWDSDGHSHSWLLLSELDFSEDTKIRFEGIVDIHQYKVFKEQGEPQMWSGAVSNTRGAFCTNAQMDRTIDFRERRPGLFGPNYGDDHYTLVTWENSMAEIFSDVVEHVIPQLEARSDAPDDKLQDDVRIVFWFDN